ncbi:cation transporter [Microbulbifer magnicolonia]|uniref:cation transporter n=1 Tax=Microbulbifer magnicolonia TaxID=3109744 RepID=UPI002B414405|nr:cation transporter [Microbulbifer sp. GG15]
MSNQCGGECRGGKAEPDVSVPDLMSVASRKDGSISEFEVPKMDCPSEERMIRMALENIQPKVALDFDIPTRRVRVFHQGNIDAIRERMVSLGLGTTLLDTRRIAHSDLTRAMASAGESDKREAAVLKWLLAINAVMFAVEMVVGWLAQSTGLIADSLDMFADAAVYGVALYAVGHSLRMKLRAAHLAGWLQVVLALGALSEVARRFLFGSEPVSTLMMGFGFVALVANIACLMLIAKSRDSGAHMKASWIFSANDVIANLGVILAGFLVAWTNSRYPDLIIGLIIGVIVLNGARRILQMRS